MSAEQIRRGRDGRDGRDGTDGRDGKDVDPALVINEIQRAVAKQESVAAAGTNASAANVKDFATMMVNDHSAANNELKEAAAKKNISLPMALSDEKQKKYNGLAVKKGTDFDKAYVDCMVDGHKDAIDAFQKESEKGNDADLRTWASGKLATLQHHYEVIKSIKDGKK